MVLEVIMKKSLQLSFCTFFSLLFLSSSVFALHHHHRHHHHCCQRMSPAPAWRPAVRQPIYRPIAVRPYSLPVRHPIMINQPMSASPSNTQVQSICSQLQQIIQHPSLQGFRQGINLLALLRAIDLPAFGHYYQIFDRQLGHFRNMQQPATNQPGPRIARHAGPSHPQPAVPARQQRQRPVPVQHFAPQPMPDQAPAIRHNALPVNDPMPWQEEPATAAPSRAGSPEPMLPHINDNDQNDAADEDNSADDTHAAPATPASRGNQTPALRGEHEDDRSSDVDGENEAINQLREQNNQLQGRLADLQRQRQQHQAIPQQQQQREPQHAQRNNDRQEQVPHGSGAQQQRITQLQGQIHQLQERTDYEHHLLQLIEQCRAQIIESQTNPAADEPQIGQLVEDYNQTFSRRFGFDIRPVIDQITRNDLQHAQETINRHSQDPLCHFFASNHPAVELLRVQSLVEQLGDEPLDAQDLNADPQDDPGQLIESAPPLTADVARNQALPPLLRNIPAPRPPYHPDQLAIPMPEDLDDNANEHEPSLMGQAWNYMRQMPQAAASGAARVLDGVRNWWHS